MSSGMEQEVATQVQFRQVYSDACGAQSGYTVYVMEQDDQTWSLTAVTEEKDLGVLVSSDLKVSRQCAEAVRKASNVLRLIKRHFFKLDKSTFLILYRPKCYVRHHLEYSVQAWSPSLQKDIVCMEQVQRRATG